MNFRILLYPFALLYGLVVALRNKLYDLAILPSYTTSMPVVSIGNLSCGGNGKTPFAIYLVEYLRSKQIKAAILTRGYGGSVTGPTQVNNKSRATEVGDEPLMMARALGGSVVVARDRANGAQFISNKQLCDIIILDDGFQHRRLNRDLNLVLIDISDENWFEKYQDNNLLPVGDFREKIAAAAARISAIILVNRGLAEVNWRQHLQQARNITAFETCRIYTAAIIAQGVFAINDSKVKLPQQDVFIFSAIANPASFIKSIKTLGYKVCGVKTYRDHHAFTEEEFKQLKTEAKNLPLICTEKDAVKLSDFSTFNCFYLKIAMQSDFKIEDFIDLKPLQSA